MNLLLAYWSPDELVINGLLLLHLLGALAVGILIGYERNYHGRAAGMRTYALVCVASTVLTAINAYPSLWYGGTGPAPGPYAGDPTRVIQGLVTGVGFLGAGVIMREGLNVRGLSTAASIWMTSAIGVVIGVGLYGAAIAATFLTIAVMSGCRRLERALPHRSLSHLSVAYGGFGPGQADALRGAVAARGFRVTEWSFQMSAGGRFEYRLVLEADGAPQSEALVADLSADAEVLEFALSPSRP